MANNIQLISSILRQTDFEDLVRMLVKHLFDTEAYLVGGPYDAGLDLIYKREGREVKDVVQITIQEKGIEPKILEDAHKTKKLVDNHGYPARLTVFWSRKLSNSSRLALRKKVRSEAGIDLEVYDATMIDQIITDDAPDILNFLITSIHRIELKTSNSIDPKARAFYDYLALGKDAADLKTSITDAQLLSSLIKGPMTTDALKEHMQIAGIRPGVTAARTAALRAAGKINDDGGSISLTANESSRITNILLKDEAERSDLLERLRSYCQESIRTDISREALDIIQEVYRVSVDVQISELSFEPPRISLAKGLASKLRQLIQSHSGLDEKHAHAVATELLKIGASNEYLSNQCSSLLCVGLLSQRKLDRYIQERQFFVYLDASVYIRYLALYGASAVEKHDSEMRIAAFLRDAIRGLPSYSLAITREHLEETIRHITQAEKISRFASEKLIHSFGGSNNVFFNLYARERKDSPKLTFSQFLSRMIGYEPMPSRQSNFDSYLTCAQRFNGLARIDVRESPDLNREPSARRIITRYEHRISELGKTRKHRSAVNDVAACYVLADGKFHLDSRGYGHAPMLVTWDRTQAELRDIFRSEFPHAEWFVYSPQRAIERFSMLQFNVDSGLIRDSVLAILDEDYTRESSLIDALASIFGEDTVESDGIIAMLTKLSGRLHGESMEAANFEADERNLLVDALLAIEYQFKDVFEDVRKVFSAPANHEIVLNMLREYIAGKIEVDGLNQEVSRLLKASTGPVLGPSA